jgi:glycosyltransferase involved in cell wall biosynthesis
MLLSIIIPVYNVELYLNECLDSVFVNDLLNCEIITVNDGSTDNSGKILSEYKRKYSKLIIIDQTNKGLSAARNAGMAYAKGEYLYFLDSDDYMMPNAVDTMIKAINSTKAEVIGFNALANGETIYIPSFEVSVNVKSGINFLCDFFIDNGFYPNVNVPLYVYQKKFLNYKQLSFKVGIYHEDVLFSLLVFYYSKSVSAFNVAVFNYRQHRDGSICTNIKEKNLIDRSNICRELNVFFMEQGFFNKYFYNTIFYQYLYNIDLATEKAFSSSLNTFFNKADKANMKKGITNDYEFKLWLLATININLMLAFYKGKLPNWLRRMINCGFTIYSKINYNILK